MAQPLPYAPPPQPPGQADFDARADLERLLQALHESGALRLLTGLVGRFEDVMGVLLPALDTPEGRRALSNLLLLGRLLGRLDADGADRFLSALVPALDDAGARLRRDEDPPGFIGLTKRLHEPEVRRGLDAVVTLLASLGARLGPPEREG